MKRAAAGWKVDAVSAGAESLPLALNPNPFVLCSSPKRPHACLHRTSQPAGPHRCRERRQTWPLPQDACWPAPPPALDGCASRRRGAPLAGEGGEA